MSVARKARPWDRIAPDEFAAGSIKAFSIGEADKRQQEKAWDFILRELCGIGDLNYHPDSVRDTDFALGKRFVAMELHKISKAPVSKSSRRG